MDIWPILSSSSVSRLAVKSSSTKVGGKSTSFKLCNCELVRSRIPSSSESSGALVNPELVAPCGTFIVGREVAPTSTVAIADPLPVFEELERLPLVSLFETVDKVESPVEPNVVDVIGSSPPATIAMVGFPFCRTSYRDPDPFVSNWTQLQL
ncbi:hypothetical protein Mapa_016161 [Marchantia paleacea]|nr:hypothetical protein Mapa_016161 [Marchantia paleacea]